MTVAQSKSITAKLWDEIDTVVAQVVPLTPKIKAATTRANELDASEPDESPILLGARLEVMTLTAEKNKLGGIGRGLAIALHLLCAPHFEDVGAVVKHAQARYKAAQAGETVETPGTGLAKPKDEWPQDPEPNTDDGFEAAKTAPKSEGSESQTSDPESPRSGTDTQADDPWASAPSASGDYGQPVDAKKSARGAKKNTTAAPSSAAASGATSSTTEDSPASPAKASAAPKATPAPTPDQIIAQDAARGPKPGVEAAVDKAAQVAAERRTAQADLEDTANEKIATLPGNGDEDDESPKSIAAMLEELEDM